MSIKLIALDMDGTLVDNTHVSIPDRNIRALKSCMDKEIHVVLASGRPFRLMLKLANQLGVRYVISGNGSGVWDIVENKCLIERTIDPVIGDRILEVLCGYEDMPVEAYYGGASHVDKRTWHFENYKLQPKSFLDERAKTNVFHDDLSEAARGQYIEKFNIDGMPFEAYQYAAEKIRNIAGMEGLLLDESQTAGEKSDIGVNAYDLDIHYNAKYENLEISRGDAMKGKALKDLCDMLGIKPDEVMAFGDSDNDISMLEFAGESYAVANATPEVKRICNHVTRFSNVEEGVGVAIEYSGVL